MVCCPLRWNPPCCFFADLFACGREVDRAAQAQGFRAQAWDTIFDALRLNLCRSAVRSRLKRDTKLGKVLAVSLAPPSGATLMRAWRVALSLFAFCAKHGVPTVLVQPCAFLLWQAPTCHPFLTFLCILSCASLDTKIGGLVPCWLTWIPVTPTSSAALALVPIVLADAQALLTAEQLNLFRADCQVKFVTPRYKL